MVKYGLRARSKINWQNSRSDSDQIWPFRLSPAKSGTKSGAISRILRMRNGQRWDAKMVIYFCPDEVEPS